MSLFPSLDNLPQESDETLETLNGSLNLTFSTTEYLFDTFLKGLDGKLTNEQIKYEIINYYDKYLDYDNFQSESTRKIFQEIWTNERFLIMFKDSLPVLKNKLNKYHNKVLCKIAYDFYTSFSKDTRNEAVTTLLFMIVTEVNNREIIPLTTIMDKQSALFIVMSKHSSFEVEECVRRVNEFIIRLGYDFSVDNIIYIYSKLYADCFSQLFNFTMTHFYTHEGGNLSNLEYSNYTHISTALLVILNSMPTSEMEKVINGYRNYRAMHPEKQVRFTLRKNMTDYDRLSKTLSVLGDEEI